MRPIAYEIRRTLTSKFVILMMVAIIGLSTLLAYESAASFNTSPFASRSPSVTTGYYISGGDLTVVTYSHDIYGSPYSDLKINVTYENTMKSAASNSAGFANFTFPYTLGILPEPVSYNYTYSLFGLRVSPQNGLMYVIPSIDYTGFTVTPGIVSRSNSSNLGFQILYVGNDGTSTPPSTVYVAPYSGSLNAISGSDIYSNYTASYNISGTQVKTVFPNLSPSQFNYTFGVAIKNQTGAFVKIAPTEFSASYLGRLSIYKPVTQSELQSLVLTGIGSILGLLIPILGVFAGYLTYGKDKTTSVLESVLKRPVTRGGLITSRFLANSVSIVASVIVSMIIGDAIINYYFHMHLTLFFSLFFIWTYVVEGLAFLALVYFFTHLVKSQGALLGISIALFVVMGLFWAVIPLTVMLGLGIGASSPSYIPLTLAFNYASPHGYSSLVSFFFTNRVGALVSVSANPVTYGITEFTLLLSGALWIAVPFIIALFLARRSD